jgi:hypothetical protein
MVALEPPLYARLAARAKKRKRPVAWEIRLILEERLDADGDE